MAHPDLRPLTIATIERWRKIGSGLVVILAAAFTAYYTTIFGIRLTLNEKADRTAVAAIDRRLIGIETVLRTDVARRDDFAEMRDEMQRRLTRIETLLEARGPGGN